MQTEQAVTDYNSDEMTAKWIIQGSAAYVTPGGWAGRHDITHKTSMYIHQWLTVLYSISFIDDRQLQPRRTGQDRTGQDRTGQERTGQDRTGEDRTGQDRTGQDRTGQDRTGQDRTGQDRTGQNMEAMDWGGVVRRVYEGNSTMGVWGTTVH